MRQKQAEKAEAGVIDNVCGVQDTSRQVVEMLEKGAEALHGWFQSKGFDISLEESKILVANQADQDLYEKSNGKLILY